MIVPSITAVDFPAWERFCNPNGMRKLFTCKFIHIDHARSCAVTHNSGQTHGRGENAQNGESRRASANWFQTAQRIPRILAENSSTGVHFKKRIHFDSDGVF